MKKYPIWISCQIFFTLWLTSGCSPLLPVAETKLPDDRPAVIFCLHDIDGRGKYSLSLRQLDELLALLKNDYQVISLAQWQQVLATGEKGKPVVVLTFDDGYPSLLNKVVPRLRQHNFGATFYIYTDRYRDDSTFFSQLAQLPREFELGSHTFSHTRMIGLSKEKFYQEIYLSRIKLAYLTNRKIDSFAWPYGAYKPEYIDLAFQAGYKTQVSVEKRLAKPADLSHIVPRFTLTQPDPVAQAHKALAELKAFE